MRNKVITLLIVTAFMFAGIALATDQNVKENAARVFSKGQSVLVSGNATSDTLHPGGIKVGKEVGHFSLVYDVDYNGTVYFHYQTRPNTSMAWITPSADDGIIITGVTKVSGNKADGRDIKVFDPEITGLLRIICTESGAAANDTIIQDCFLVRQ